MAVANVRNTLTIDGVDNASAAIDKARKSLQGLEGQAGRTGKATQAIGAATGENVKKIRETSGDMESALKGIKDFTPGLAGQLSGLGDAFGATEAVMRLIPGTAGLVATGLVAVGAGAYLLAKNVTETAEKLRQLGNADTLRLKDNLDLSTDGAIKLTQALDGLKDRTLKPTDDLLAQVARNAVAMGKDGAEAATAFVAALESGGPALAKFQQEYGKLNGLIADQAALVTRLGLNAQLLGISKADSAEQSQQVEIGRLLTRVQERRVELATAQAEQERKLILYREGGNVATRIQAGIEASQAEARAKAAERQLANDVSELAAIQNQNAARKAQADAITEITARADVLDAKAALASDKKHKAQLQSEANTARLLAATKALNAFDRLHGETLTANLQTERAMLEAKVLQAEAAKQAEKLARQQAAAQASAQAAANRAALTEAKIGLLKAQAVSDGIETRRETLAILEAEETRELNAARAIKNKALSLATVAKVEQEYANKRKALDDAETENIKKNIDAQTAYQKTVSSRTIELAMAVTEAKSSTYRADLQARIESLRAEGNADDAAKTELLAAEAEYTAKLRAIEKERAATIAGADGNPQQIAAAKLIAEEKTLEAMIGLEAKKKALARAEQDRMRQERAEIADSLNGIADAFKTIGQSGNTTAGAIGASISSAIQGFKALDLAMKDSEINAQAATAAIGGAATGIASAWIDAERTRTTQQLDAEEKRALSTATTEEQRARITADFEAKKAQAVEDAERRKAAILAIMEIANVAASYPNVPAMVAHGTAAALYGSIAGGLVSVSGGGAAGGGGAPGGFNATTTAAAGGSGGSGKAAPIVNNYYGVFGTPQKVASQLQRTSRALASTGMQGRGV